MGGYQCESLNINFLLNFIYNTLKDGDVMLFSDEYFSPWGIYLFTNDQYCLQPYLDDGSNLKLKLEVCVDDVLFLKQIHYFCEF